MSSDPRGTSHAPRWGLPARAWAVLAGSLLASCGGTSGREHLVQAVNAADASSDVLDPADVEGAPGEDSPVDAVSDRHRIPKDGFSVGVETTDDGGVESEAAAPAATCGNGILEPGEECDDGNKLDADGCSSFCTNTKVCDDCLAQNCDPDFLPACSSSAAQSAAGGNAEQGPAKGAPRLDLCHDLYVCAERTGCAFATVQGATGCYCGTGGGSVCFTVKGAANGKCKAEVEAATETTEGSAIQGFLGSTRLGVGWATTLLQCAFDACPDECKPRAKDGGPAGGM